MFYWETDKNGIYTNLNIYKGGELVGKNGITLFKYADKINDFSVKFGGKTIYLSSSLAKDDIDWSKLTFAKQGDIAQVYYNGEKTAFKQTDNYIYFGSEPVIWDPSTPKDPDSGSGGSGGGGGGHGSGGSSGTKQTDSTPAVKNDLQLNKEKGIAYIKGYDNGLMQPDKPITRGEVVTALYRLVLNKEEDKKGKVEFTDVSESNFAYDAIEFMQRKNIISGYEDNTFRAENGITRGEFAKIISSFADSAIKDNGSCPFTDISSSWAKDYIKKVFYAGWINGYPDKTYRPDNNITRAEFTAIINKVLGRVPNKDKAKEYENYFTDINTEHWAFADMIEASVENYGNTLAE